MSCLLQGVIVVKDLPNNPAAGHEVQVALNWTANSEELLSAIEDSYRIENMGGRKVALIQVVRACRIAVSIVAIA